MTLCFGKVEVKVTRHVANVNRCVKTACIDTSTQPIYNLPAIKWNPKAALLLLIEPQAKENGTNLKPLHVTRSKKL